MSSTLDNIITQKIIVRTYQNLAPKIDEHSRKIKTHKTLTKIEKILSYAVT